MPEHIRYARNRREFLTDCFCGAGSLAFASMLAETAGARRPLQSAGAQAAAHAGPRQGEGVHLRLHGRRPVAPRDLGSQTAAQPTQRPEAPRRVRRREVSERQFRFAHSGLQADLSEVRQIGHRSLRPLPAPGGDCRRSVRHPLHARRYGGAFGRPVSDDDRPRRSGLSGDGQLGGLRPRFGSRVAAGLRRDARSARRAGGRPADVQEWLPAGGLPAHHAPPRREAGAQSGSAEGSLAGGAPQDHRPDPLA